MIKIMLGHYAYWFILILLAIGLYGMIIKTNIIKKVIGMTIFQVSIILFFIASSSRWMGTVPILVHGDHAAEAASYINPLPHTLMLTAIVVGVATLGVALALVIVIFKRYQTLDEALLQKEMRKDDDTE